MPHSNKLSSISLPTRLANTVRRSVIGKNQFITRIYREIVIRWHGKNEVQVGEFMICFDPRDRFIASKLIVDGSYEKAEIETLCSYIVPGDLVLDIGANIGLYTLPMSRAVGETGAVIAFEPDPDNVRFLRQNVQANGCNNVHIVNCALGNLDEERDLFQNEDNRGYLSFADLSGTDASVKVPVRRGDQILEELGVETPAVAKIDVEGAEPLVLEGLGSRPRCLQLEFVTSQLRALDLDPLEFLQRLVAEGYSIATIDRDTGDLDSTSAEDLVEIADRTGDDYNLMLLRSS